MGVGHAKEMKYEAKKGWRKEKAHRERNEKKRMDGRIRGKKISKKR